MQVSLVVFDYIAVFLLALVLSNIYRKRRTGPLPPGPSGWPVIGNLLDMPSSYEWKTFAEWGEKWGDIVSITMFEKQVVILNSSQLAFEMFDKKGGIYSDRPVLTVLGEIVGWNRTVAMLRYGPQLRHLRKFFSQVVGSRDHVEKFSEILEYEVHKFLVRVLRQPATVIKQVHTTTGTGILKIAYGYQVEEEEDALLDIVHRAVEEFSAMSTPGAFLVDTFPILQYLPAWVPGAGWKNGVQMWTEDLNMMFDVPYKFTKEQMLAGTAMPSFTSKLLETNPGPEQEARIKHAAASLYGAGADTTVSSICTFFLAMMCFPEVQRKAQAEIDAVIGYDRLPQLADRDHLPYVNALCLEVLRWQPVVPLGFPHTSMEDDVHAGYFIPKGTTVIANVWKFLHDPKLYVDPFEFKPDRFIPSCDQEPEKDPRQLAFGFGRRICPGLHLAEASLFLSCVMSLAVFDIAKPTKDGAVIEPSLEYTSGTLSYPQPFEYSIKPRSANAEALILSVQESR